MYGKKAEKQKKNIFIKTPTSTQSNYKHVFYSISILFFLLLFNWYVHICAQAL